MEAALIIWSASLKRLFNSTIPITITKIFNTSLDYLVGTSNCRSTENIKKNQETYCSDVLLNDIRSLSTDSLKDLEHFIIFLKFRDRQINSAKK